MVIVIRMFDGKLNKLQSRPATGFTLLELVMVMTIVVILAATSVIAYQKLQLKSKEVLLKQNLKTMRKVIDQYAADKEELPQSLEDLVSAHYIDEVPMDPVLGQADWDVTTEEDSISIDGGQGIVDVHSKAPGTGSDGMPYSEY